MSLCTDCTRQETCPFYLHAKLGKAMMGDYHVVYAVQECEYYKRPEDAVTNSVYVMYKGERVSGTVVSKTSEYYDIMLEDGQIVMFEPRDIEYVRCSPTSPTS